MKPDFVLDTNVYLEQVDLQDLIKDIQLAGETGLNSPKVVQRRKRARAAILLAWYFHVNRKYTVFNGVELTNRMLKQRRIDPNAPGDVPTVVTALIAFVVHEKVLSGWVRGSLEPLKDLGVGTAIDEDLLCCASRWNVPLITNEGNTTEGFRDNKRGGGLTLRGKARQLGVPVYAPSEYLETAEFDLAAASSGFLQATEHEFASPADIPFATSAVVERAKDVLRQLYLFILQMPEVA